MIEQKKVVGDGFVLHQSIFFGPPGSLVNLLLSDESLIDDTR